MANRIRPIVVSEAERRELERLQRSPSTAAGLSRRARAVLLMAQGVPGVEIADRTGYTVVQVSRVRRRFAEHGLAGLQDRARSGRPPTITARKRAQIVAWTLKPPAPGLTHWSTRDLARKTGVSHGMVHGIWRAHALKPHRVSTFKFTTDPAAEDKIYDVVGLYLNPPTNAVVLRLDEKTQIQALSRTQPLLPLRPGLPARQTHDYRRNGLTSLYAALEVTTRRVIGDCAPRHTGADFLAAGERQRHRRARGAPALVPGHALAARRRHHRGVGHDDVRAAHRGLRGARRRAGRWSHRGHPWPRSPDRGRHHAGRGRERATGDDGWCAGRRCDRHDQGHSARRCRDHRA